MRFYLPGAAQPCQTPTPSDDEASDLAVRDMPASGVSRRSVLRVSAVSATGAALVTGSGVGGPYLAHRGLLSPDGAIAATGTAIGDVLLYTEVYPVSPLILQPFKDPLTSRERCARPPPRSSAAGSTRPGRVGRRTRMATNATRTGAATSPVPDPLVYRMEGSSGRTASPRPRSWPSPRAATRSCPSTPRARPTPPAPSGTSPLSHDLRVQRDLPGAHDQCRVRPAGDRAVHQPAR